MLGGLSRWLRMLGYVTEYDSKADDNILLRNSQTPDTVLLTRDEELYNRALAKSIHSVLVLGSTRDLRNASNRIFDRHGHFEFSQKQPVASGHILLLDSAGGSYLL